ncbi:alpha-mannosidase [Bifidobacterium callitrichos]|uniref:Alpha-mannosidase n=1 Tax=Bifidobacterium callitrichos TaxID=762209 RepID=A0A5M9ZAW3_9BIFI|nr:alpha-mannosidase [Bifidobacterium callitrichos]KAA8815751.1 alpha-mannosidase [Bifidobacterium callitrichos]
MLLKVNREIDRCKRVMRERVWPHIHQTLGTCAVGAVKNPGEPEASASFIARAVSGQVEFQPLASGEPWGTSWGTTWMRVEGQLPADLPEGRVIELVFNLGWLEWPVGGHIEALAYRADGTVIKALHPRNHWMPLIKADGTRDRVVNPDGSFVIYVEGAYNPNVPSFTVTELGTRPTGKADERYEFGSIDIAALDQDMFDYWADLDVITGSLENMNDADPRYWKLAKAMQRSINLWDERDYATLAPARKALDKVMASPANASAMTLTAMGHSHIDSAWLWPVRETQRKVGRTVSNVLALMDMDPNFTYVMSAAQHFAWLEERHPDLFERVKERIAEGRFIPVGGMWVESDGTMPCGESLIRQISYGKRYFKEKLGVVPNGIWLPDSFGYTGAWPQIAKRSGYSWFLTQKLCWNDTTRLPHHSFMWEGVDGSQIFTHFPPADKYDSDMSAHDMAYVQRNYKDKDLSDRGILLFGFGDGGGGPIREMTMREHRFESFEGMPKVEYGTPDDFFAKAESEMRAEAGAEMPRWKGEFYFELHRKTLTSQQEMKRGCRKTESALRAVEYLGTLASLESADYVFPQAEIDRIWKTLLLNQFHDILPGSAIEWAHRVAREDYERDMKRLHEIAQEAVAALREANPDAERIARARISQLSDVASWTPVSLESTGEPVSIERGDDGSVTVSNGLIRAHIAANGTIDSMTDLVAGREMVAKDAALGRYEILKDEPGVFDAWDVERDAFLCATPLEDGVIASVETAADGSALIRTTNRYRDDVIDTVITLRPGRRQIDFHADVDWKVPEKLLKVDVPMALSATRAQYECQYGLIERPVVKNTEGEEAMFESCSHRFVRIHDSSYGIGVANGSTYGSDVSSLRDDDGAIAGTMVRLSLVAAPTAPDPRTDIGRHEFDWTVLPCAEVAPLVAAAGEINAMTLEDMPALEPPVSLETGEGTPVIDWIKLADDGSGDVIVRLYEAAGARARATLHVHGPLDGWQVRETNTLEQDESYADEPAGLVGGRQAAEGAALALKPFQLTTLRLSRV